MAPQMAASALRFPVPFTFLLFLVFLFYFVQPLVASRITYSREERMHALLLLNTKNKDALCFNESWLSENMPDAALHPSGFQLLCSDSVMELSGKTKGGRTCFYVSKGWCTDDTVLKKFCSPHVECFFINCRPFYPPQEFASFVLVSVFIPPQACVTTALQNLAGYITDVERKHPDSLLIITSDFNKANLSQELPRSMKKQPRHLCRCLQGLDEA